MKVMLGVVIAALIVAAFATLPLRTAIRSPVGANNVNDIAFSGVSWTNSRKGFSMSARGAEAQLSRSTGQFSVRQVLLRFPRALVTAQYLEGELNQFKPIDFEASGGVRLRFDGGMTIETEHVQYLVKGVLLGDGPVRARLDLDGSVAVHRARNFSWDTVTGTIEFRDEQTYFHWADGGATVVTANLLTVDDQSGTGLFQGNARVNNAKCRAVTASLWHNSDVACQP